MKNKFSEKLIGPRIVLKKLKPDIKMAEVIFKIVDENRKHLEKWLPWVKYSKKVEDTLEFLFSLKIKKEIAYGIFLTGEYVGNIGAHRISKESKSAELGYWLAKKYCRQGYMTEAVRLMEKELFDGFGLNRVQIRCDKKNKDSAEVAKRSGYKLEGEYRQDDYSEYFNDFRNTLVFSKLKSEYKKKR